MKKAELIFSALLVPIDWVLLLAAGLFAYAVRFNPHITEIRPIIFELPVGDYFELIITVATFWILIFALSGLYLIRARSIVNEIITVSLACSAGLLFVILYIFWSREFFSSRFIVLLAYASAIVFVSIGRIIVRTIQRRLYRRGIGKHGVVLIGDTDVSNHVREEYEKNSALGFRVVGQINDADGRHIVERVKRMAQEQHIDDVLYIDNRQLPTETVQELVNWCNLQDIAFHFSSSYLQLPRAGVDIVSVAGIPIMEFKKTTIDGWGRIFKRAFDIIFSLLCIIIAIIPMVVIGILIKITSNGPVLFSKLDDGKPVMRVGQYGKPFHYFKFRSMKVNTNNLRYSKQFSEMNARKGSPLVKIKDDPRITSSGKWLRRFSLDELPELFLVLIGKMSLVGPRPHLPEEVEKYEEHQKMVLTIKPGITGLSQISGRSDLTFEEEVKNDMYYIQNWSLRLDVQILIKTIPAVIRRREAA